MAATSYNKLCWLINQLKKRSLTLEEIQREWENSAMFSSTSFSKRTFHEHKKAILLQFGISIACGAEYRYYIENPEDIQSNRSLQWALNSFSVTNMLEEGKDVSNRIVLEQVDDNSQYLTDVVSALRNNIVLQISYRSYYSKEARVYHLRPYCLRVYNRRWYVLGYCEEHDGLRHFALNRMQGMELTDVHFIYPSSFDPKSHYEDVVGVFTGDESEPEIVILRAHGIQANYLANEPIHKSQKRTNETAEYSDFEYLVRITPELITNILARGSDIQVLWPKTLQQKVKDELQNALNRYGD